MGVLPLLRSADHTGKLMFDRMDATFAAALEREIALRLQGDINTPGLYRTILSSQNWEIFQFGKGSIFAYEEVLKLMREVARRMNEGEEPVRAQAPIPSPRMN